MKKLMEKAFEVACGSDWENYSPVQRMVVEMAYDVDQARSQLAIYAEGLSRDLAECVSLVARDDRYSSWDRNPLNGSRAQDVARWAYRLEGLMPQFERAFKLASGKNLREVVAGMVAAEQEAEAAKVQKA